MDPGWKNLTVKLDAMHLAQLEELKKANPFATTHALSLAAMRAGLRLFQEHPERLLEFADPR